MQKVEQNFDQIFNYLLLTVIFLLPFFFIPFTRDFLVYSKFYLLFYVIGVVLLFKLFKLIGSKKFIWIKNPLTQSFLLIIFAYGLSILLRSPNKSQALFNPQTGFFSLITLIITYFMMTSAFTQIKKSTIVFVMTFSGFVTSLMSVIMLANPFKNMQLSADWGFLKSQYFNPVGSQIELFCLLLFIVVLAVSHLMYEKKNNKNEGSDTNIIHYVFLIVIIFSLVVLLISIIKAFSNGTGQIILPPFSLSWYAAAEILKYPAVMFFGVGVDNYASIFTKVRDMSYNMSDMWQISSFAYSRSTLLHIFVETGLLGLSGVVFLFIRIASMLKKVTSNVSLPFILASIFLLVLPPTFLLFFLFFVSLAYVTAEYFKRHHHETYEVDLSYTLPLYVGVISISLLLVATSGYLVSKNLLAEIYFKRSMNAILDNNLKNLYENQQKAVQINPFNEDFRINFSQTNLLVANNLAAKKKEDITDSDRQTITQAIQAAIAEAKAAVALNNQKVTNWQNLAAIYKNIINVAKDAEVWTVSAYQQAIIVDPQNPIHRVELGGVFYLFKNYPEAQKLFEQAVSLKPDWANAHYNLAWALAQQKNYQAAASEMQGVLSLLDPKKAEGDYKRAQKDLEEFKKNIPQDQQSADKEKTEQAPKDLVLPSPPTATVEPKLKLNNTSGLNASPSGAIAR